MDVAGPGRSVEIVCLGSGVRYKHALDMQRARVAAVVSGSAPSALLLVEHTPVITLGRNSHPSHLLARPEALARLGVEVVEADRGGDVTYHGPGQLVAYPILDLSLWRKSVNWYLRTLEEVLIEVLAEYGLRGERAVGLTGVWVAGAKVAAIGVGLRRWVTYHGIALNVDPNLEHFGLIVPCGIPDKPVTSLARLLATPPTMGEVTDRFIAAFQRHFA